MQIYFLGTGTSQGIPVIGSTHPVCQSSDFKDKRLRVSVWVTWENHSIVIDCGPDFRQQMLNSNCQKLDALLFTHEHADHTAGLDDIRPFFFKQKKAIPVYAHIRVLNNLKNRFDYIFTTKNKYPGAPSVETFEIKNNESFLIGQTNIIPIHVDHGNLPIFGYRIQDFVYLTDVKRIEAVEMTKLRGVKVLVVNALREEPHHSHFSLQDAIDFIHLVQPERAYLTHVSHLLGFHEEVQNRLPANIFLAYDNLKISI
jgi:phosphoribosyl 1,2-cyclic phosphate phosphodiesterase